MPVILIISVATVALALVLAWLGWCVWQVDHRQNIHKAKKRKLSGLLFLALVATTLGAKAAQDFVFTVGCALTDEPSYVRVETTINSTWINSSLIVATNWTYVACVAVPDGMNPTVTVRVQNLGEPFRLFRAEQIYERDL